MWNLRLPVTGVGLDGSFVVENTPAGRFRLRASGASADYYLKRIRFGGEEIPDGVIEVAGEPEGSLDLLLSARAGRVDGSATDEDGKVRLGTRGVLIPEIAARDRTWLYKTSSIDQNGSFSLRGITPGEYLLFAWERLESNEYYNPDFVRRYESQAERVVIEEGSRLNINLRVITADETP